MSSPSPFILTCPNPLCERMILDDGRDHCPGCNTYLFPAYGPDERERINSPGSPYDRRRYERRRGATR